MTRWEAGLESVGSATEVVQLGLPLGGESDMALWYRAVETGWDPAPYHGPGATLLDGWQAAARTHLSGHAEDAHAQWKRWFESNASHWDEVDDIEAELGRGADDEDDEP